MSFPSRMNCFFVQAVTVSGGVVHYTSILNGFIPYDTDDDLCIVRWRMVWCNNAALQHPTPSHHAGREEWRRQGLPPDGCYVGEGLAVLAVDVRRVLP